jgi:hypothetical protein
MNWETILETDEITIQSTYNKPKNSPLGEMLYRLTSSDDKKEKHTMIISPHEVINIFSQVREKELCC